MCAHQNESLKSKLPVNSKKLSTVCRNLVEDGIVISLGISECDFIKYNILCLVCLFECCLMSRSTTWVMSRRLVNLSRQS